MSKHYDVIVIGAGPAGSIFCARAPKELAILQLDGDFTRQDGGGQRGKPCGGLLAPQASKALKDLGLTLPESVLAEPQITLVHTMDLQTGREQDYVRHYRNVDRGRFDNWLKSLAGDNVTCLQGRATYITRQASGYRVEYTTAKGQKHRASATYLIGADGAGGPVRRVIFPKRQVYSYTALQRWYPLRDAPLYACIFHRPTSPSCSWLFAKDGRLAFGGAFQRRGSRAAFLEQERILREQYGYTLQDTLKEEACMVYRPRRGRDVYFGQDGCYLAGEAAGLISPSSFEGISYALKSGAALAKAFREVLGSAKAPGGEKAAEAAKAPGSEKVAGKILRVYRKQVKPLKRQVLNRRLKRPFMYWKPLRNLVLASGVQAAKKK